MLDAGTRRLEGLELAIVAGEICPSALVRRHLEALPTTRLFNEYGPTEATVWATVHEASEADATRPVPIGRPIPGTRIHVMDRRGRRVPPGIPGELHIGGPSVASGYHGRPELTRRRFVDIQLPGRRERVFRSGDRASWGAQGRLRFHGRVDEQIKLRGFRIEPAEVEATLLRHPDIAEAVVVARTSAVTQEGGTGRSDPSQLVAFVRSDGESSPAEWRAHAARHLPGPMVPSRIVELSALPQLPSGKVDRARLKDEHLNQDPA